MAYDGTLKFDTKIDASGFQSGLSKLGGLAKTGLTAATAAVGAVSGALAAAGGYAVKVGSSFEQGMAQVSAISGATGKDLDALTDKAAEMGAKTIFSASQSAEAFQYMAMAGWKTEDMLSGIEGVMNLAAASGEDLGQVSDIVTDALTAFGLQAKDSAHFADVLAKAASNSNTNVGLMGYTFKYAAPIAGALKYSVEDVAVAIGLMANQGIKGEMAGTSLRSMMTRLAKPTKDVQEAMSDLGISAANADGSMKPLNQLLKELRGKFSNLSDSQKAEYAATIAGQEAMSGMLAIVNASQEDFDKLTAAISDADGAAQDMADTMQDTLKGDITILKSALEGLGNTVYDELQDPLRGAAQAGIDYVNQLKAAFEHGGLQEAVATAGDIFAELTVKAAEKAPDMINAAVSFIQSFVSGIRKHAPELLAAARNIVNALVDGLVRLLPKEIQKPVKETVETLKKSFKSGGLRDAIKAVGDLLKGIAKTATNIAKVILPPLAKIVDALAGSFRGLAPLIAAAAAGFVAMKVVGTVTTLISHLRDAISLATIAQNLWNAAQAANPIGMIVGIVAGVAGAIGTYCSLLGGAEDSAKRLEEAHERLSDTCDEAWDNISDVGQMAADFMSGIDQAESHLDDFRSVVFASAEDQQKLQEEMEGIQKGITTICQTAAEERRGYTEKEIEELEQYFTRLRELQLQQLEQQKVLTQATIDAEKARSESFEGSAGEYAAASQGWLKTTKDAVDEEISLIEQQVNQRIALENMKYDGLTETQKTAGKKVHEDAIDQIVKQGEAEKEAAQRQYGELSTMIADEYAKRAQDLNDYVDASSELNRKLYEDQKQWDEETVDLKKEYNRLFKIANGEAVGNQIDASGELAKVAQQLSDIERKHTDYRTGLLEDYNKKFDDSAKEQFSTWLELVSDAELYGGRLGDRHRTIKDEIMDAWDELPEDMRETAGNIFQPIEDELDEKEPTLFERFKNLGLGILGSFKRALGITSPSKEMRKATRYTMEGAQLGLKDETPALFKQSEGIASGLLSRFQDIKLDASALVQKMRATIAAEHSRLSASLSTATDYRMMQSAARRTAEESTVEHGSYVAEIHVDLDGREVARATAPFMGSQLAWEGSY